MRANRTTAVLAIFLALASLAGPAEAGSGGPVVKITCDRLGEEQADELASRIHLTLAAGRGESELPRTLVVACDDAQLWVIWDGPPAEILRVAPGPSSTEAVVEAVEARLRRGPPPPPPDPEQPRPGPEARAVPAPDSASERRTPRLARHFTHGGVSLGTHTEVLPPPFSPVVGARLDVGVGIAGALAFVLSESARFGSAPAGPTFGYDMNAGVAWGAPFDTLHELGARASLGVDWVSSRSTDGTASRSTGVAELGVTGALYSRDYALWLSVGSRYRMKPQTFGSPTDLELPHFSAFVALGGAVLVDVSRRSQE